VNSAPLYLVRRGENDAMVADGQLVSWDGLGGGQLAVGGHYMHWANARIHTHRPIYILINFFFWFCFVKYIAERP